MLAGVLGEGRLEIEFASHSLYPFQPPTRLAYRNDALSFAQVAAVAAATVRQACNMIGECPPCWRLAFAFLPNEM